MSTLTSSPSPAGSPRVPAISHFAAQRRSSIKSPLHQPVTASPPARPQNPASARHSQTFPRSHPPASERRPQYADVGTQYTPEAFPPTDRRNTLSDGSSSWRKRKESSPPPPMTSTADTANTGQVPPPEPLLRETPKETENAGPSQKLPERPAVADEASDPNTVVSSVSKRARTSSADVKIMPAKYETCNPKDLGVLIANMLMELIRLNDNIPLVDGKLTRFHSRAPPGISCQDYLLRLIQHATLSPPILLSMVYYIDRLCALYPAFTISSLTVHRFLITAATVASKGLSDSFWTNPTYARIGGISTSELATLELDFLQRVQFRIVPKPETLVDYYRSLIQRSEGFVLEGESQAGEMEVDDG